MAFHFPDCGETKYNNLIWSLEIPAGHSCSLNNASASLYKNINEIFKTYNLPPISNTPDYRKELADAKNHYENGDFRKAIIACASLTMVSVPKDISSEAEELKKQAMHFHVLHTDIREKLTEGKFTLAIDMCKNFLAAFPNHPEVCGFLETAQNHTNWEERAVVIVHDRESRFNSVIQKQNSDDLTVFLRECNQFLKDYPNDSRVLALKQKGELGLSKMRDLNNFLDWGLFPTAQTIALEILQLFPQNKAALCVASQGANVKKKSPNTFDSFHVEDFSSFTFEDAYKMFEEKKFIQFIHACKKNADFWTNEDKAKAQNLVIAAQHDLLLQDIETQSNERNFSEVLKLCQKFSTDYPTERFLIEKYQSTAKKYVERMKRALVV